MCLWTSLKFVSWVHFKTITTKKMLFVEDDHYSKGGKWAERAIALLSKRLSFACAEISSLPAMMKLRIRTARKDLFVSSGIIISCGKLPSHPVRCHIRIHTFVFLQCVYHVYFWGRIVCNARISVYTRVRTHHDWSTCPQWRSRRMRAGDPKGRVSHHITHRAENYGKHTEKCNIERARFPTRFSRD